MDFSLEFACSVAVSCEDSCTISPLIIVNEVNGVLKIVHSDNLHNWTKDFLFVTFHSWFHIIDNCWSNKIAIRVARNFDPTTIQENCGILSSIIYKSFHSFLVFFAVQGSNVKVIFPRTNFKFFGLFNDLRDPCLSVTN